MTVFRKFIVYVADHFKSMAQHEAELNDLRRRIEAGESIVFPVGWWVELQEINRQPDCGPDADDEHDGSGHGQAPSGNYQPVSWNEVVPECSAFRLTEAPSHHHQPDAPGHNRIGRDGDNQSGQEQDHSGEAHGGKPFLRYDSRKAVEALSKRVVHARFPLRFGACGLAWRGATRHAAYRLVGAV
ncbi:hypothetical protein [Celeribacter ethanolicus]|uniref:hypothetical protein n=1 Tax=Celeribacter ethanolicus TaxID=1758178 RepID=UPI0012FD5CE7|nr:hypothetical protein [Celeribacter ethanolicus]